MTRFRNIVPVFIMTLVSVPVLGDDINCQSEYGDLELDGNLMVAAPCRLDGTSVGGDVKIFAGGSLVASGAEIDGNIDAELADFVDLRNTEVDGNVKLNEMVGDKSTISDSTIEGNLEVKENRSRLELLRNYIDKNLKANENSGGIVISDNVIDGNLQCKKNDPEPEGGNNMVSGNKDDQCRNLQAAEPTGGAGDDGGSGNDGGSASDGGSGGDGGTGTTGDSEPPPIVVDSGRGGGGSSGPLFPLFLLAVRLLPSSRRNRR